MTTAVTEVPKTDTTATQAPATTAPATTAPATTEKPAETKTDDSTILGGDTPKTPDSAKPGEQKPTGAPEKYADFVLPEGMALDKELADKASAAFKDLNLSQDQAQKLVDLQTSQAKAHADAIVQSFNKQVADWKDESKKSFGADYQKQFGLASKAVEQFGTPELRQLLNDSGLGNHPQLVRFFAKVGKAISEGQPVDGRRAGSEQKSDAEVLYPSMKKK